MSQSDIWPSDEDASDSRSCHILTSDDDEYPPATLASKSRLRPAGKGPLPSTARDVETSDEEPTILYNPKRLRRSLARQTRRKLCCQPLIEWSNLPNKSKGCNVTTVTVTFYYTYIDTSKPTKEAASAEQQGEYEGKHHQLHPYYIRMLADYLQAGKPLNGYDDVLETFHRLKEREEREKQRRRKRRRQDLGDIMAIDCHSQHCVSGGAVSTPELVFPTTPLIGFDERREDLVRAYGVWQRCQVSEEQKGFYEQMQYLTLHHGIDLDMIVSNQ
ncbi:hypothetical protein V8C37DRAFT_413728 [Trichoderma ceciliae]